MKVKDEKKAWASMDAGSSSPFFVNGVGLTCFICSLGKRKSDLDALDREIAIAKVI